MKGPDWETLNKLLTAALDLAPEDRAGYVAETSAGNPGLAAEAMRLLELDQQSDDSLERWIQDQARDLLSGETPAGLLGAEIGPYRITEELGRGGMGVVYKAIRSFGDADRPLAFKVLRGGGERLGRLGTEHSMLARLDHPNISRIIDSGRLDDGTPFLVMDYVAGEPIDQYCDRRRLTCRERLKLFQQVCSAVNCAHQNLIVHCDLKPKNILVTPDGIPHLLDFGIARLESQNQDGGRSAAAGVMTPGYASPEQIMGRPLNTLSDVYSLGVLLYELLTGCRPHPLPRSGLDESWEVIQSQRACPPSRAVSSSPPETLHHPANWRREEAARIRKTEPHALEAELRGDLDSIVLKALERDPRKRYASVAEFSEDIQRHLGHWPVSARGATLPYRASRFIRRHRVGVALASTSLVLMLVAMTVVLWQAEVARTEKERARFQSRKAERISEFLQRILSSADFNWYVDGKAKGPDVTVRQVLDEAAKTIDSEFAGNPELKAEIHHTIGNTYRALTLLDQAGQHFQKALELRRHVLPPNHPKIAESYYFLGAVRKLEGDYGQAALLYQEAYAILSVSGRQEANFPFLLSDYADLRWQLGELDEAERLAKECLQRVNSRNLEGEEMAAVNAQVALAHVLTDRKKFWDAAATYASALERGEGALGAPEFEMARTYFKAVFHCQVAGFFMTVGCPDQAGRSLSKARRVVEPDATDPYPQKIECMVAEGELLARRRMLQQAEQKAEAAWNRLVASSPGNLWVRGQIRLLQGRVWLEKGQANKAEESIRSGLADLRANVADNQLTARGEVLLAESLRAQRDSPGSPVSSWDAREVSASPQRGFGLQGAESVEPVGVDPYASPKVCNRLASIIER